MTKSFALTAEQRTARFQDRMRRKRKPLNARAADALAALLGTTHRGRRIAALAAAIAVPAMAAPGGWEAFQPQQPQVDLAANVKSMPFEMGGQSFPGSAFYYLEDAPRYAPQREENALALFDMSGTGKTEAAELTATHSAGPAARAFLASAGGLSHGRAIDCLTKAVYYEAASEAIGGQRAVAQVVLNRVAHPSYPNSVCGVVFQGSERKTGCQFSFTCDGSLKRVPGAGAWARAQRVAQDALSGTVYAPVGLATHYHTIWIYPYWAPSLDPVATIGAHRFYRWKGLAGKPGAFNASYSGLEPAATGRGRQAGTDSYTTDAADPVALARAYEEARLKAVAASGAVRAKDPAPVYSQDIAKRGGESLYEAENLPSSGTVKPEYANSGRWLNEPK